MIRSRTAQIRVLGLLSVPLFICCIGAPAENLPLTLMAFGVLGFGVIALWRPSEPPLTMLLVIYQWLQISTKIIHADLLGVRLDDMLIDGSFGAVHPSMGALFQATALSLLGLTALILGIAFGQRHSLARRTLSKTTIDTQVSSETRGRILLATGAFMLLSMSLKALLSAVPGGLHQIILPLIELKWAMIFALTCAVLRSRSGYLWLTVICVGEILLGLTSYFSAWKEVILILSLAYFYCRPSFDLRRVVVGFAIFGLGFVLAVFWTAIKSEQRGFLNMETGQQIVVRGRAESLANVFDLGAAADWSVYSQAVEKLAQRIAYVDFFANALIHVPASRAHENGKLWGTAVTHVLTPRILFSNKPPLQSDSELTMEYTGLFLASNFEGTSISLGYMAESYVDFGAIGMHVPIFLWGIILGFSIRLLVNRFGNSDVVWGMVVVVALNSLIFEVATVKMVGGTLMSLIVIYLFMVGAWPWLAQQIYRLRKFR